MIYSSFQSDLEQRNKKDIHLILPLHVSFIKYKFSGLPNSQIHDKIKKVNVTRVFSRDKVYSQVTDVILEKIRSTGPYFMLITTATMKIYGISINHNNDRNSINSSINNDFGNME